MGARYTVSRTAALSTTADHFTLTAPATRALKIWEIRTAGQGIASAANELLVSRVGTLGVTGATPITPTPLSSSFAAASATVFTAWTTQPVLGAAVRRIGVNANGAINNVVLLPGNEIDVAPSAQISFRSASGTSSATVEIVFEEVG